MPDLQVSPMVLMPQINLAEEIDSTLPLEQTVVHAQVIGPIASVAITQRFGNPLKEPAELDYLFPLPDDAAIAGFELTIGSRRIIGDVLELEAARQAYETGKKEGKRAGLFEQHRPNLFALRIANVGPGETITALMRYQQRIKFQDDSYEFVFPMGITPKYGSPAHPEEGKDVQFPIASSSEKVGPVEIEITVDAGVPLAGDPHSPSHALEVARLDERRFHVRLAGEQIPDHDFVLRYKVGTNEMNTAGWSSGGGGKGEYFLATLVPQRLDEEAPVLPRDFVFVLDRSGSMSGPPIQQARNALRACLRTLTSDDTFRLLLFDNVLEWYTAEPVHLTQGDLERADHFLSQIDGRGGTEIVGAIDAALSLPAEPNRSRYVIFLTDGAVSAEERALEQIRGKIGSARLFTFGIGPSVNRALLNRMARLGRGQAEFLQLNEDIEGAIIRFQDSVSFPMLTDLSLTWENGTAWDVYPAQMPDLYAGQPLDLCGRVQRTSGTLRFKLTGKRAGKEVILTQVIPEPTAQDQAVERTWARARIDDLVEQQALLPTRAEKFRAEVIGLALEHHMVTEYTAFVAVDSEPVQAGGKPRLIHIAQPLPEGLQAGAFQPVQQFLSVGMPPPSPMPSPASYSPTAPSGGGVARMMSSLMHPKSKGKHVEDPGASYLTGSPRAITLPNREEPVMPDRSGLPAFGDREGNLRWLARTQQVDGSWGGNAERTAAAALAFIRSGNTTRAGSYRQMMRKALRWLETASLAGPETFLRSRVLSELAEATHDPKDQAAAQAVRSALPVPATLFEKAALDTTGQAPPAISSIEDLRLVVLLRVQRAVPEAMQAATHPMADLIRTWAASIS